MGPVVFDFGWQSFLGSDVPIGFSDRGEDVSLSGSGGGEGVARFRSFVGSDVFGRGLDFAGGHGVPEDLGSIMRVMWAMAQPMRGVGSGELSTFFFLVFDFFSR